MKALVVPFTEGPGGPHPHHLDLSYAQAFYPAIADEPCVRLSNAFIYPIESLLIDQAYTLSDRGARVMEVIAGAHNIPDFDTEQDDREHSPQRGYFCVFSAAPDDEDPAMANGDDVKYWFVPFETDR